MTKALEIICCVLIAAYFIVSSIYIVINESKKDEEFNVYMASGETVSLEIVYDEKDKKMYGINLDKGYKIPMVDENGHYFIYEADE